MPLHRGKRIVFALWGLLISFCLWGQTGHKRPLNFEHISIDQGLSSSRTYMACRDPHGFVWIATEDGLNRYDGYDFEIFRPSRGNPAGIGDNRVRVILPGPGGELWIGTRSGLDRYDPRTGEFTHYVHDPGDPDSISNNAILSLCRDTDGSIRVGSFMGLDRLDPETGKFRRPFSKTGTEPHAPFSGKVICSIFRAPSGNLWVGTSNDLFRFDPVTGSFSRPLTGLLPPEKEKKRYIYHMYQDSGGRFWVCTEAGLFMRPAGAQSFVHHTAVPGKQGHLQDDSVRIFREDSRGNLWTGGKGGLYRVIDPEKGFFQQVEQLKGSEVVSLSEDSSGCLWICTADDGCYKTSRELNRFYTITSLRGSPGEVDLGMLTSVMEDRRGELWLCSPKGLFRWNAGRNDYTWYRNKRGDPGSLHSSNAILTYEDRRGTIWIGTNRGLEKFNRPAGTFTHYSTNPSHPRGRFAAVLDIVEDEKNGLWLGTLFGLNRFDRESEKFEEFIYKAPLPMGFQINHIIALIRDRRGTLWMGTLGGLTQFDPESKKFTVYSASENSPAGLSHNIVNCIFEDGAGNLWAGTGGGLNRFDRVSRTFRRYFTSDGLPSDIILAILEDSSEKLWLSTPRGIARFDPLTGTVESYDKKDGLTDIEMVRGHCFKSPSGEMYFSGSKGVHVFSPANIIDNQRPPEMVLTGLTIFNENVPVGKEIEGRRILDQTIGETRELRLSYRHSVFSLEYSGLHYVNPAKNRYAYKLEGLDREWNYVGHRRLATYTYIPSGKYRFRVKGCNSDGVWNETGISLDIAVTPPFWKTWWFLSILVVLTALGILLAYLERVRRWKRQEQLLSLQVEERTGELNRAVKKAEEANVSKSLFLARMSHEIRTPMNSVVGFTDLAMEKTADPEMQEFLQSIKLGGDALLEVINEILDVSKIEAGRMKLEFLDFDPEVLAFNVCDLIIPRLGPKRLEVLCRIGDDVPANVTGDPGRFRQVLTNLMGNAVKFTGEGAIELSIDVMSEDRDSIKLNTVIKDSGIGIAPERLESIFKVYEQGDASVTRKYGGTGLGLPICKQIARLMKGDIEVESTPGKGSTFHFTAWFGKSAKKADAPVEPAAVEGKKVLFVDDNLRSRTIYKRLFRSAGLKATVVSKGAQVVPALKAARDMKEPFDLCILDIHMPEDSGYAVAKRIRGRSDNLASIPLLALSASVDKCHDKLMEHGFDGFLPKPTRKQVLVDVMGRLLGTAGQHGVEGEQEQKRKGIVTQHSVADEAKQSVRILMAEDNELNRKLANFILTRAGYRLDIANNGKQAVEMFLEHPDRYDLILMDIQMPEMDGIVATKHIREKGFADIPIIALTASTMKGDRETFVQAGMDDFVPKPVKREVVYKVIKKWIFEPRPKSRGT